MDEIKFAVRLDDLEKRIKVIEDKLSSQCKEKVIKPDVRDRMGEWGNRFNNVASGIAGVI